MKHYYLVASLPTLVLGEPPAFGTEEMAAKCANVLSDSERQELALVLEGRESESANPFLAAWMEIDTQLRNSIARVRASKLSVESRPYLHEHRDFNVGLEKAVTDAYTKPNPYEREMEIDRFRWETLDEMVLTRRFSFDDVLAWALKLRIAERWAKMTEEAGREHFEKLAETTGSAEKEKEEAVSESGAA